MGVESTMSVNMIVTVPSTASEADRSAAHAGSSARAASSETVSDRPRVSRFDRGNDQWTWTTFHPSLEVEDLGRARLERFALPADQLLHPAQPTDLPPGLDLGGRDREAAGSCMSGQIARVSLPKPARRGRRRSSGASIVEAARGTPPRRPPRSRCVHRSTTRRTPRRARRGASCRHRCRWTRPAGTQSARRTASRRSRLDGLSQGLDRPEQAHSPGTPFSSCAPRSSKAIPTR